MDDPKTSALPCFDHGTDEFLHIILWRFPFIYGWVCPKTGYHQIHQLILDFRGMEASLAGIILTFSELALDR